MLNMNSMSTTEYIVYVGCSSGLTIAATRSRIYVYVEVEYTAAYTSNQEIVRIRRVMTQLGLTYFESS